ncbi:aldo/keto reductase [Halostella sp. JP-L12]|uniref:aldo/keto reductase n=1 Tax=Halostella TaxID=1843185 RepID=UPI000EF77AEC|nr:MULTISPECIES: aldo/keto reductase [Halostella]NHN47454.1 aldo/keto reductase [Halostella sp. JP-L12]
MATGQGTWDYRDRFGDEFGRTFFRRYGDGVVSSVGVGTYLGDPTDEVDDAYREAIVTALESGVNVVDTAINYRCQRSERVVGAALDESDVDRDAVLVATKGGFVSFDGERPANPGEYVREEYVEPGLIDRDDLARGSHCIAPDFLDDQIDRSLSNLDVEAVDLYYVHNAETQLAERSRDEVYDRLEAAFRRLEERVAAGDVKAYGVATWDAFRVPPEHDSYLSLSEVVSRARAAAEDAGNDTTGLRAIQLPFNVVMADAFTVAAHDSPDGKQSALRFANDAGLNVFTSASIAQGRLADEIPDDVAAQLAGDTTAQQAINFARSAPGVTCSLVGASSVEHVEENVAAGTFDPLGAEAFDAVFE